MRKYLNGISLSEAAKRANVSNSTISRAVNNPDLVSPATLNRIVKAMNEMGADISGIQNKKKKNLSEKCPIILSLHHNVNDNPHARDVIRAIKDVANKNHYLMLTAYREILDVNYDILELIKSINIVGIITHFDIEDSILLSLSKAVPVVQVNAINPRVNTTKIYIDDFKASYQAVNYLISKGCKKIAMINVQADTYYSASEKLRGYMAALKNSNIEADPNMIIEFPEISLSTETPSTVTQIISLTLQYRDNIDAFFCGSDVFAVAALMACVHEGIRVPEEVKIIGYDNVNLSTITTPKITSVSHDRYQIGYSACTLLIRQILDPLTIPSNVILDTELVIRESTI